MDQDLDQLRGQIEQMKACLPGMEGTAREEFLTIIREMEGMEAAFSSAESHSQSSQQSQQLSQAASQAVDEYAAFEAEIAAIEEEYSQDICSTENGSRTNAEMDKDDDNSDSPDEEDDPSEKYDLKKELDALEGMKCLAPHEEGWGQIGYYPAMVSEVITDNSESLDGGNSIPDIKVRVIFLQPVVKSQLLCPFYQEDRCRFSSHECRFSHGEIVLFSQLRDYSEPDYSQVVPSARVLAKYHDSLWYPATIIKLTGKGTCEIKFDLDKENQEVEIHETVPILRDAESSDESSNEDFDNSDNASASENGQAVTCDLLQIKASEALGDWEKHTKGLGSKIMMKMGYVMGCGLGKEAEGRVLPVDAVMVPQGMSLDQFMELKERKNLGNDCFTVEKKLKRGQRIHAKKEKRKAQQSEQQKSVQSVFDFMNSHLSHRKHKNHGTRDKEASTSQNHVAKQSCNALRKDMLGVGETLRKTVKDISKIKQSIKRVQGRDPATEAAMKAKVEELEKKKDELVRLEISIMKEQKTRSDKRKLTEF